MDIACMILLIIWFVLNSKVLGFVPHREGHCLGWFNFQIRLAILFFQMTLGSPDVLILRG